MAQEEPQQTEQSVDAEPDGSTPLTNPKQERFCREWVIDHNGTQAAIRAGYSPRTANEQAARMLTIANVRARVNYLDAKIVHGLEIAAETTVKELAKLAYVNMDDFVIMQADGSAVLNLEATTREHRAAIQEITVDEYVDGKGEAARPVKRVKVKLYDKRQALVDLGRHQGIFQADNERRLVLADEISEAECNELRELIQEKHDRDTD